MVQGYGGRSSKRKLVVLVVVCAVVVFVVVSARMLVNVGRRDAYVRELVRKPTHMNNVKNPEDWVDLGSDLPTIYRYSKMLDALGLDF